MCLMFTRYVGPMLTVTPRGALLTPTSWILVSTVAVVLTLTIMTDHYSPSQQQSQTHSPVQQQQSQYFSYSSSSSIRLPFLLRSAGSYNHASKGSYGRRTSKIVSQSLREIMILKSSDQSGIAIAT